jgi:hypothetical protein
MNTAKFIIKKNQHKAIVAYLQIIAHLALEEEKSHMINMTFSYSMRMALRSEINRTKNICKE